MFEILCQALTGLGHCVDQHNGKPIIDHDLRVERFSQARETVQLDRTSPSEAWAYGFIAPYCIPSTSVQVIAGKGSLPL